MRHLSMNTRLLLVALCALGLGGCERPPSPPANTPPVITLERPTTGQVVREGDSLQLTARVEDAEDGPALAERVVWVSSRSGQLARGASATLAFSEQGAQTLTATVIDSGGQVASASLSLQVLAPGAPGVTLLEPSAGSEWNLGEVLTLRCEALSVSGEQLPDAAVQWTSALSGPLSTGARAQASLGVAGEDTLTCTATDPSTGARASASVPVTVRATQAPAVQILRPGQEEFFIKEGEPLPYSSTVLLNAIAYDFNVSEGDTLADAIEWRLEPGGTRLGTGASVTHTFDTPGQYTVVAQVTDSRGNQAQDSVCIHLVSNLPPRCDILHPREDGARLLLGASSRLEARCVDPETGAELLPTWRTTASTEPLGETRELNAVLSVPGAQELSVCAKDPDTPSLEGCARRSVRVISNSAPRGCALLEPLASAQVNAGVALPLRGTATDDEDPQLELRYTWSSNRDGVLAEGASTTTSQLVSSGAHTLRLTVMDPWGLSCSASLSITVNGSPTVGISSVMQDTTNCLKASCSEGTPLVAIGTATDTDTPEGIGALEWVDSLTDGLGTENSATLATPGAGKHTLVLRATDRGGAVGRAAASFAVLPQERSSLVDTLVSSGRPVLSLAAAPGEVLYVDGESASLFRVPSAPPATPASVALGAPGLAIFRLEEAGGPVLFVGTREGVERCVAAVCTRYRGGVLPTSGEPVRSVVALSAPDLLLLATDEGIVLTRASNPSAGGPAGTIVGRRVLEGLRVRQLAVAPLSPTGELKLWAATEEGLAELTLSVETPFEPALALVTTVLHRRSALPGEKVHAITLDAEGRPFAGTDNGWGSPGQRGPALESPPWSFPDEQIQALLFERRTVGGQTRDVLWAGTRSGLVRYDLGLDIATRFGAEDGLPGEDVRALAVGPEGNRYIGTALGVGVYSGP
ncbi:MAG TPA: PKD domain-containing protein [Myxococcaceae bacterium]|nr:PKD domain-containing protein [Myxococcaceae bacterium]